MATLRDIQDFINDIEARPPEGRTITQEDFADVLQSLASVSGSYRLQGGTDLLLRTGAWTRMDLWDAGVDTQGFIDGMAQENQGYWGITNSGAGVINAAAMLRFNADVAGEYRMRLTKVSTAGVPTTTQFFDAVTIDGAGNYQLVIASAIVKDMVGGQKLQIDISMPVGASIQPTYGQFGVNR